MSFSLPERFVIPEASHGQRLDLVLAQHFPEYSRSRWGEWLKQGKISCKGKICRAKDKAQYGSELILNIQAETEILVSSYTKAQNIPLNIVYEDDDLIIINKPAGLIVHPGAGNPEHTLLNALLHHYPDAKTLVRAGIVHRLDKETTGLMVIAKTAASQTNLIAQLQSREIKRSYLALVYGHLISGGEIHTFFGRHPKNRLKMAVLPQGKEALTYYHIERQYHEFTLLEVQLASGRTHQIRVHMAHIKHPLIGDPLYGQRLSIPKGASDHLSEHLRNFKRQALHAARLNFTHPVSKKTLDFTAPLPEDFTQLLSALDRHYGMD